MESMAHIFCWHQLLSISDNYVDELVSKLEKTLKQVSFTGPSSR